jgi:hypothetical protein
VPTDEREIIESYGDMYVTSDTNTHHREKNVYVGDIYLLTIPKGYEIPVDNVCERLNDEVWEFVDGLDRGV